VAALFKISRSAFSTAERFILLMFAKQMQLSGYGVLRHNEL
jgi:hypothetical protein